MQPNEVHAWLQQYPPAETIKAIWIACYHHNAAIAIWRLPQSNIIHCLADFSNTLDKSQLRLHEPQSGFAISPFINPDGTETLLLKPELYIRFEETAQLIKNQVPKGFWDAFSHNNENIENKKRLQYYSSEQPANPESEDKTHFIQMVKKALQGISSGHFDKVVLARSLTEQLPRFPQSPTSAPTQTFDLIALFDHLSDSHQNALASLVSIPEYGTWMGASPETLVKTDSNNHFYTHSLAGTQPLSNNKLLSEVSWNQKEIEEQAMVSRYIIEQFKALRLREFIETGPMTVKAGELLHLKTCYQVDMKAINRPTIATEMLHLLHPTAAVCGLPKQPALQFIQQYEALQRKLYSGYLGPVNMQNESHLFVNLRCMQIQQNKLIIYAGCGITHHSDPEKEWLETTLKCNSLKDVLNG